MSSNPRPRRRPSPRPYREVPRAAGSLDVRMFEALSDRFDGIFKRLRGRGRLREEDVDEVLREIRLALLEADANLQVGRRRQARIRERAIGLELNQALNPAQQVIKIVHEELINTL